MITVAMVCPHNHQLSAALPCEQPLPGAHYAVLLWRQQQTLLLMQMLLAAP
jgi:hypothetical protein